MPSQEEYLDGLLKKMEQELAGAGAESDVDLETVEDADAAPEMDLEEMDAALKELAETDADLETVEDADAAPEMNLEEMDAALKELAGTESDADLETVEDADAAPEMDFGDADAAPETDFGEAVAAPEEILSEGDISDLDALFGMGKDPDLDELLGRETQEDFYREDADSEEEALVRDQDVPLGEDDGEVSDAFLTDAMTDLESAYAPAQTEDVPETTAAEEEDLLENVPDLGDPVDKAIANIAAMEDNAEDISDEAWLDAVKTLAQDDETDREQDGDPAQGEDTERENPPEPEGLESSDSPKSVSEDEIEWFLTAEAEKEQTAGGEENIESGEKADAPALERGEVPQSDGDADLRETADVQESAEGGIALSQAAVPAGIDEAAGITETEDPKSKRAREKKEKRRQKAEERKARKAAKAAKKAAAKSEQSGKTETGSVETEQTEMGKTQAGEPESAEQEDIDSIFNQAVAAISADSGDETDPAETGTGGEEPVPGADSPEGEDGLFDADLLDSIVSGANQAGTEEEPQEDSTPSESEPADSGEEDAFGFDMGSLFGDGDEDVAGSDDGALGSEDQAFPDFLGVDQDDLESLIPQMEQEGGKKKGLFARLFDFLTEEDEDEENNGPKLSDENREILNDLDKEKAAGKKKKNRKKPAPGKDGEEEEEGKKKGKKAGKAKKPKPEKPKKEKEPEPAPLIPEKRLTPKRVIPVALVCLTIGLVIIVSVNASVDYTDKKTARDAYYAGDYQSCYENLYGKDLNETEQVMFGTSESILRVRLWMREYEMFVEEGKEVEALDSLLQTVTDYPELYAYAVQFNAGEEVTAAYQSVLAILSEKYGLTEEQAMEILSVPSDYTYTEMVVDIVMGKPFGSWNDQGETGGEQESQPAPAPDLLPEEEDLDGDTFIDNQQ